MSDLSWKIGVEIELIAPLGLSRQDVAESIAQEYDAVVRRIFHLQSEPSQVPGTPLFDNLTLGFEIIDRQGNLIARCVDDLTLQDDLNKSQSPQLGWYRIVSDDLRILELVRNQADPTKQITEVLQPIARLFGTKTETSPEGMIRVSDRMGNPVAIAAPLPGERERPCELVTSPITHNHQQHLDVLLNIAHDLGLIVPIEGAIHIHFDGKPLCSPRVFANLVNILWTHGDNLKRLVKTNPRCKRLGRWQPTLWEMVNERDFCQLSWSDAKIYLAQLQLTKYCDFNLKNLVEPVPELLTFEVRIFPVWMESQAIIEAAALMAAILDYAITQPKISPRQPLDWQLASVEEFLKQLPLSISMRDLWLSRAQDFC
ncbi:MAG: amidoligase family protein [Xenococcaceae cyanobacterium]